MVTALLKYLLNCPHYPTIHNNTNLNLLLKKKIFYYYFLFNFKKYLKIKKSIRSR
ncbi:conserved hypothetical protein [Xenorhabdus bovienii str. kraussei Becker Underwood]|uniref:Uncharacterized protein n=1 Tax=Xenorhabdus bovienii str. kraussei Becker Underwood TaxID=1398204 RepID=A0A077PQ57_XENBV|nr:conserved hypothetical protein [Xenorhabdus bovienii str. kraussei Becker Underwood]